MSKDDVFVFRFFGCRFGKAREVGEEGLAAWAEGTGGALAPRSPPALRPLATFSTHPTWEGIFETRLTNSRKYLCF